MATTSRGTVRELKILSKDIITCTRCARLAAYREDIGRIQKRAYRGENYWSKPVPGFGDPAARLLIVGLAPGAHGANRTGRIFTGDRSGDFLYRALWQTGFANQPDSTSRNDGLALTDAYITSSARCVPPGNKPAREELLNCRDFLRRELQVLTNVQVVVALGGIALSSYLALLQVAGLVRSLSEFPFKHGAVFKTHDGGPVLISCYHPSQQNTFTGRLTAAMLRDIFLTARSFLKPLQ